MLDNHLGLSFGGHTRAMRCHVSSGADQSTECSAAERKAESKRGQARPGEAASERTKVDQTEAETGRWRKTDFVA